MYRKSVLSVPRISCSRDEIAAYECQSALEKRHELLKSGLQVAPVFLKENQRIEALLFVYFLAQSVCALIERQLRNAMRKRGLPHIQILPEDRPSTTSTTEQVIRVFSSRARHLLLSKDGKLVQTFRDPLSSIQEQILELLSIFPSVYP